jgi:Flp pilus assembly protein TadD
VSDERARRMTPDEEHGAHVIDLYRRGTELLDSGDFNAAAIPLEQAAALEPDKSSIREALGRAYFRSGRFAKARDEFALVVEQYPTNDFAHFCLGRAFDLTGDRRRARKHLTLAAGLRPDRADYRAYRDRVRGD